MKGPVALIGKSSEASPRTVMPGSDSVQGKAAFGPVRPEDNDQLAVRLHSGKVEQPDKPQVVCRMPLFRDGRQAVDDRLRRHGAAVMEGDAFAQCDAPRRRVRLLDALRQARIELQVAVEPHQRLGDARLVGEPAVLPRPRVGRLVRRPGMVGDGQDCPPAPRLAARKAV